MLQQVFAIVAPMFLIVGVGYFYGSRVRPDLRITNQLIMDIFVPALILHVMIQDDFHPGQYFYLMIAGCLVMLGSGVLAYLLARFSGFHWRSFVPPAMFCNWANLGLPLYVFALGDVALGGGLMLVVVGNILCFTLGTYIFSGKLSSFDVLKTPIIIAVILGGAVNAAEVQVPVFILRPVDMLGQVAIPMMLFSLGVRLTHVIWTDTKAGLVMAVFSPIVGVLLAMLCIQWLPLSPLHQNILLLFGVLPPAIINFMLAEQYHCEPAKVASMVLIGNLSSIVTIPFVLFYVLAQ